MTDPRHLATRTVLVAASLLWLGGCATAGSHYERAREANTVQGYEDFIRRYPDSDLADQARARIDELEAPRRAFEAAKAANTVEAYRSFIREYPGSEHVKEANHGIRFINLKSMTIHDILAVLSEHRVEGSFTPDESPSPYLELGVFEGPNLTLVIARFDDFAVVDIPSLEFRTGIDMSQPTRGYKTSSYMNLKPFFIMYAATRESVHARLSEALDAVGR